MLFDAVDSSCIDLFASLAKLKRKYLSELCEKHPLVYSSNTFTFSISSLSSQKASIRPINQCRSSQVFTCSENDCSSCPICSSNTDWRPSDFCSSMTWSLGINLDEIWCDVESFKEMLLGVFLTESWPGRRSARLEIV